jgi:hypothetical protein
MARVRPTEWKAIIALLNDPADSVEDLATDVIQKIDALRADRKDYFVLIHDPGVCTHLHGPYITKNAAHKAVEKGDLFAASQGATYLVLPLHDSTDEGIEL